MIDIAYVHRICQESWEGDEEAYRELDDINQQLDEMNVPSALEILEAFRAKAAGAAGHPQSP